ncbi:MAG: lysozyme [Nitrospiraceae bacterium]
MKRLVIVLGLTLGLTRLAAPAEFRPLLTPWLVQFLKHHEGLRLRAYQDTSKQKAIGYGHRVGAKGPWRCTKEQAEKWLCRDIKASRAWVEDLVTVPLTQGQYDALTSLVFNAGPGTLKRSELLTALNRGEYDRAGRMLSRYCKSDGRVRKGLKRRRFAEMRRYFTKEA